ncbi:MAG: hypothetical protein QXD34_03440 [Candidatus Bathyarchaeia archaeon]
MYGQEIMKFREGFVESFLVLGFAIFIAGLLTGILAVALVNLNLDSAALVMMFSLGFLLGILTIALVLVSVKLLGLEKTSSNLP